jgi:hypothetical protein
MDSEHEYILRSLVGKELSKLATIGDKLYPIEHPIASRLKELCFRINGEDICGLRIAESMVIVDILAEYAQSGECTEKIGRFGGLKISLSDPNLAERLRTLINGVIKYHKESMP